MTSSIMVTHGTTGKGGDRHRQQQHINLGRDAFVTFDAKSQVLTVKGPNCDRVVKEVDSFSLLAN